MNKRWVRFVLGWIKGYLAYEKRVQGIDYKMLCSVSMGNMPAGRDKFTHQIVYSWWRICRSGCCIINKIRFYPKHHKKPVRERNSHSTEKYRKPDIGILQVILFNPFFGLFYNLNVLASDVLCYFLDKVRIFVYFLEKCR